VLPTFDIVSLSCGGAAGLVQGGLDTALQGEANQRLPAANTVAGFFDASKKKQPFPSAQRMP
jgi:hypothetical protein